MGNQDLREYLEIVNSEKSTQLLKQREKIKKQEWFFKFEDKIPDRWLDVNFMDVTWLITCGVAKKPVYVDNGIPFLSAQNTRPFKTNLNKIKYVSKEAFEKLTVGGKPEKNDILYTRVGNCGEAASIPYEFDFGIYVSLTLIKPIHELINDKFLVAFLNSNYGKIQSNTGAIGIGLKNLNVENVRKYRIPLPPLDEQKAIVKKIEELFSSLDSGIADLKKAQEQLVIYRQAVLKKAFEGELTKEWREKNPISLDNFINDLKKEKQDAIANKLIPKSNYFPSFEENELTYKIPQKWVSLPWKTTTSNNKYAMKRGPFGSALKKEFFVEKGIVVYEQGHAINDEPFRHRYYITPEKYQELKAFTTKGGDMIISCSGATLGRVCLLPDNADVGVINQALLKIDLNEKVLLKKFFLMLFRSETFQRLIFEKSLGSAMPNMIGMSELREIPLPIPSIEEQTQIVREIESRLSVCDKVEESLKESLEKAKALRQSILKKAFEGKLLSAEELAKCKADKDYEPASVLLERIKKEKKNK